jgi:uncharacterized protein YqhQ
MAEPIRLGGMALANGVLVHGPTAWACAVRLPDGTVAVEARRKRVQAARITNPVLRGPARLAEALALLPQVKRALPAARLPFERPSILAAMAGTAVAGRAVRRLPVAAAVRELLAGALSVAPAALALRGGELAGYHGAEHVTIGTYEHGEPRPKEHERCGSHLVAPVVLTTAAGNAAVAQLPPELRGAGRLAATVGSLAAATEMFGWMTRHPDHPLARALARPGYELQHRLGTEEPSKEQLEVARAALDACLALERVDDDA